jgi:hypothetical protein
MHWHELTKAQKEQILESHIFVEEKRDGKIKARKVASAFASSIVVSIPIDKARQLRWRWQN